MAQRFHLGSRLLLSNGILRPLPAFFAAPYASYDNSQQNIFLSGDKIAEYKQKMMAGFDLGYALNAKSQMRLLLIGHVKNELTIGSRSFPTQRHETAASLRWNYFGQNSPQNPTCGLFIRGSANWFFKSPGADTGFPQARSGLPTYLDEKHSFRSCLGGTTLNRQPRPFGSFPGGLFRLGGFCRGELREIVPVR